MASSTKSVITLKAIREYFGKYYENASDRGENALESGHLLRFTYDGELNEIRAQVSASQRDLTYSLRVSFTRTKITDAFCPCTRGTTPCHHLATALIYANKNCSVTDGSCSWSVKKKAKTDGKPINNLYPKKKPLYKGLSNPLPSDVLGKVVGKVEQCKGGVAGLFWVLSPEVEGEDQSRKGLNLLQPRDILFSDDFKNASCKEQFIIDRLRLDWDQIVEIASATAEQASNPLWAEVRQWRVTASNFGRILSSFSANNGRSVAPSILQSLYAPRSLNKVKATMWGRDNESTAIEKFQSITGNVVKDTGVWLHECGFLGSSPDGLVGTDAILEVKCPWQFRNQDLKETYASPSKKNIVQYAGGRWVVNRAHDYYHQIQGELLCTRRSCCFLVLWSTVSLEIVEIGFDPEWSANVPLLQHFYFHLYVPYVLKKSECPQQA